MSDHLWNILLVEDDEDDYQLTLDLLEKMRAKGRNYHLQWASTYAEGLKQASQPDYDVALVDYGLGAHNGVELIHAAVAGGSPLAFVLLTGQGNYAIDLQAMLAGADDYLNKTDLSVSLLERSIRYAISHKRSTQSLAQANARLQASEERFKLALSNTPVTVATIDRDLNYTWLYNPRLTSQTSNAIGLGDDSFLPPDAAEVLTTLKKQVLASEQGLTQEVLLNTQQGMRTYILALEPMRDSTGAVTGMTAAALDITEQREMERAQLQAAWQMEAQRHLLDQREMERQQIARNLHDGPIQEVMGLMFRLQEARSLSTQPAVNEELDALNQAIQKLADDLREVCNELRPPLLVRFGIERAIRAHAEDYARRHKTVAVTLDLSASLPELSENLKLALYRIFQESLNNITRHSLANRVAVRLRLVRGQVQLEVQDNGQGFQIPGDWVELARSGHLGLVGMRERAQAIGGQLEVFSRPGKGTRIRVTVPV